MATFEWSQKCSSYAGLTVFHSLLLPYVCQSAVSFSDRSLFSQQYNVGEPQTVILLFLFLLASITKATVKWLSKYDHVDLNSLSKIEGHVLRDIRQNCNSFEELGHNTFLKFICSEENLLELLQSSMNVGRVTSSNIPTKKEIQSFMLQCGNGASEVNFFWHFIL